MSLPPEPEPEPELEEPEPEPDDEPEPVPWWPEDPELPFFEPLVLVPDVVPLGSSEVAGSALLPPETSSRPSAVRMESAMITGRFW